MFEIEIQIPLKFLKYYLQDLKCHILQVPIQNTLKDFKFFITLPLGKYNNKKHGIVFKLIQKNININNFITNKMLNRYLPTVVVINNETKNVTKLFLNV